MIFQSGIDAAFRGAERESRRILAESLILSNE